MAALPKQQGSSFNESDLEKKFAALGANAEGQAVFAGKCAACHGAEGQGLIGPNLTDKFWIHGKGLRADILKTVSDGVVEKGMPAWAAMLKEEELFAVVGYVYSLRANPKAGKEPQGAAE
jgi:cytochrome c oxidase cbb3-type subunit 3